MLLARHVDAPALARAVVTADYRRVALMTAAHLALFLGVKAWRWRLLLAPVQAVPVRRLYAYALAGCAVTNLFPARAGQAARVALLRRDGVPVTASITVLVVEELCNACVLGLVAAPLLVLLPLPPAVRGTLALVGGGAAIGLALLVWVARAGRARPAGLVRRVADGLAVLRQVRGAGAALGLTAAMWAVDLVQIAIAFAAVGVAPSYAGAALVLVSVNVTNAFPVTPGQLGLFEAASAAAAVAVGASPEQGVAIGVLYHMMQLLPETALGLAVLGRGALGGGWRRVAAGPAAER